MSTSDKRSASIRQTLQLAKTFVRNSISLRNRHSPDNRGNCRLPQSRTVISLLMWSVANVYDATLLKQAFNLHVMRLQSRAIFAWRKRNPSYALSSKLLTQVVISFHALQMLRSVFCLLAVCLATSYASYCGQAAIPFTFQVRVVDCLRFKHCPLFTERSILVWMTCNEIKMSGKNEGVKWKGLLSFNTFALLLGRPFRRACLF